MLKKIIFLFIVFCSIFNVSGQVNSQGIPAIVNYPPGISGGSEQNWNIVQDKRGILYIGNDESGVLEYDGSEWRSIPVNNNSRVRSLACADDGTVYVGAVSELGYLAPDVSGDLKYNSLLPLLDSSESVFTDVWKIYCVDNKVYFHTEMYIFIYNIEENSVSSFDMQRHPLFGFYENGTFYCGFFTQGLMFLQGDTVMLPVKGGDYYSEKNVFALTSYDENTLLVSAAGHGLSLLNTETGAIDSSFADESTNNYLNENPFLTDLEKTKNGDFVASIAGGGVIRISSEGELLEVISKSQGLQDQAAYRVYESLDSNPYSQIWTALSIGVSKIAFESPLREFTELSGFQGLIFSINAIDDRIFIGTNVGLYASKVDDYIFSFEKLSSFSMGEVWDLIPFTLDDGEKILLALSVEGLKQVHKDGRVIELMDQISGEIDEEDRILWGFDLTVDPYNPERLILGGETSLSILEYINGNWIIKYSKGVISDEIRTIGTSLNGDIWFGSGMSGIGLKQLSDTSRAITLFTDKNGLPDNENNSVFQIDKELLIGTKDGIYRLIEEADTIYFVKDSLLNSYLPPGNNWILNIYKDLSDDIWISLKNNEVEWQIIYLKAKEDGSYEKISEPFLSLGDLSTDKFFSNSKDNVWFTKSNILYNYDKRKKFNEGSFSSLIRKVVVDEDTVVYNGAYPIPVKEGVFRLGNTQVPELIPNIRYSQNNVEFRWSSPFYVNEDETEFSYYLEGFSKSWSGWDPALYQDFTNLPQGNYLFRIRAKNVFGEISEEDSFAFVILRPWYLSFFAFLGYIIIASVIIYIIIALYTRRLKNENIRLEGIIQDRTAEIRKQKEELTDSIEYASRIQRALLPPEHMLVKHNLDHFILFRPRDIVSGDFYWFGNIDEKVFIVAADCTGHGVPGAFMSMLGISFLDEIIIKSGVSETNKILDALRNHVITSLKQTGKSMEESTKDGMDLSMVAIDTKKKSLQYSGAYNPLYVVRQLTKEEKQEIRNNGELELERGALHNDTHLLYQVKADHMPIGYSEKVDDFNAEEIKDKDASIYLFSDGYVDQFGGPMGKKFMSRNFKKLLLEIQHLSMDKQLEKLEQSLDEWMGEISQIDDILVIGIKV